jgi:hypothetical protein
MVFYIPHFNICATVLLSYLKENLASLVVPLDDWDFIMMVEMGFFVRTGQRYQVVIPSRLTMGKVKGAALKMAQAEYPRRLVTTMRYAEAKAWQARLRGMDEDQRCADRHLLLETPSDFLRPHQG